MLQLLGSRYHCGSSTPSLVTALRSDRFMSIPMAVGHSVVEVQGAKSGRALPVAIFDMSRENAIRSCHTVMSEVITIKC